MPRQQEHSEHPRNNITVPDADQFRFDLPGDIGHQVASDILYLVQMQRIQEQKKKIEEKRIKKKESAQRFFSVLFGKDRRSKKIVKVNKIKKFTVTRKTNK